jgi:hypothetical protein
MNHVRILTSAGAILAGLAVATSPALAAPIGDGTSNTIQVAVTSATLDQAHHRAIVTAPRPGGLTPGRHFGTVEVVKEHMKWTFSDILVESLSGSPSALSLNFTKVELVPSGGGGCRPGVDACLIEQDGILPPA